MANRSKPVSAKKHVNPRGRVAFFCYVKTGTLRAIKRARYYAKSQGHVIDLWAGLNR